MESNKKHKECLHKEFESVFGRALNSCDAMSAHASTKLIYRLSFLKPFTGEVNSLIALTFNIAGEFKAYNYFTQMLLEEGAPVPKIYHSSLATLTNYVEDLGDITLYNLIELEKQKKAEIDLVDLSSIQVTKDFSQIVDFYKQIISLLPKLQLKLNNKVDYNNSFPRSNLDAEGFLSDFRLFFEEYMDPSGLKYDKAKSLLDAVEYTKQLCANDIINGFVLRDLQSRNVLIYQNKPYFIDFQAARSGPLQYDIASLLCQTRANLSPELKDYLLEFYILNLKKSPYFTFTHEKQKAFRQKYSDFVIARLIQAIGSYGRAGYRNNKPEYLNRIPKALLNLKQEISKNYSFKKHNYLYSLINNL